MIRHKKRPFSIPSSHPKYPLHFGQYSSKTWGIWDTTVGSRGIYVTGKNLQNRNSLKKKIHLDWIYLYVGICIDKFWFLEIGLTFLVLVWLLVLSAARTGTVHPSFFNRHPFSVPTCLHYIPSSFHHSSCTSIVRARRNVIETHHPITNMVTGIITVPVIKITIPVILSWVIVSFPVQ